MAENRILIIDFGGQYDQLIARRVRECSVYSEIWEIIRGGENLYPKEIEEFIYTHPSVQDVQVIGVPDKKYGEEAMACIILKEGESVVEKEMHDFIAGRLARHKVPRYIKFVDSFPMNAAGKVLKYKMREDAAKELGLEI